MARQAAMTAAISLLSDLGDPDGAAMTFRHVLGRIRDARETIEIHMFVWRSDGIGNEIGRAVLAAADRGVKIRITKDTGAFMYERIEMNRKSFLNKAISPFARLRLAAIARRFPDTRVEDDYDDRLGHEIMG